MSRAEEMPSIAFPAKRYLIRSFPRDLPQALMFPNHSSRGEGTGDEAHGSIENARSASFARAPFVHRRRPERVIKLVGPQSETMIAVNFPNTLRRNDADEFMRSCRCKSTREPASRRAATAPQSRLVRPNIRWQGSRSSDAWEAVRDLYPSDGGALAYRGL